MSAPLSRYVRSLGASQQDADDLVQEVALRVVARDVAFTDAPDLRRYCFVVARNLWIDECRRRRRLVPLELVPDVALAAAEQELLRVDDRHLLRTVSSCLVTLSDRDQEALLTQDSNATSAERNRAAVARFRARSRLHRLVGPFVGVLGTCLDRVRAAGKPTAGVATAILPVVLLASISTIPTPDAVQEQFRTPTPLPAHRTVWEPPLTGGEASPEPRAPKPVAAVSATSPKILHVEAPSQAHLSVGTHEPEKGEPLFCTRGDLIAERCLALPPGDSLPR